VSAIWTIHEEKVTAWGGVRGGNTPRFSYLLQKTDVEKRAGSRLRIIHEKGSRPSPTLMRPEKSATWGKKGGVTKKLLTHESTSGAWEKRERKVTERGNSWGWARTLDMGGLMKTGWRGQGGKRQSSQCDCSELETKPSFTKGPGCLYRGEG